MLHDVLPVAFLLLGAALRLRAGALRRRGAPVDPLLAVASGFAAVAGLFLLAVTYMSGR